MSTWYLEGFDLKTRQLVREHPLQKLDVGTIRRVLKVYDDYPIEPFDFLIPNLEALYELAEYSDEYIDIDESLQYDLAFHAWE
jgi:hypothetical protein